MTSTSLRSNRGSVLLVALVFSGIVAIALTSYLQMARTAMQVSQRAFLANDGMNIAEAALEQTLWAFNQANAGSTTAWDTTYGWESGATADDKRRNFPNGSFSVSQNAQATAKVYVKYYNSTGIPQPVAIVQSTITPSQGMPIVKQVEIYMTRRSFFSTGLVARNGITFSGQNASVDSWNSDPDNDTTTAPIGYSTSVRQAHGSIATTSLTATVSVQNADIYGYVSVGASNVSAISLGTGGTIGDFSTPTGTMAAERIATNFTADLPLQGYPTVTPASAIITNIGTGNPKIVSGHTTLPRNQDNPADDGVYYYTFSQLDLTGNSSNKLVINSPAKVVFIMNTPSGSDSFQTAGSGGVQIDSGASLAIYTAGNVVLAGNGVANLNNEAYKFQIWGTNATAGAQTVDIVGNGDLRSIVYAPNASVYIRGNGEIYGAAVGNTANITGNANFHYDESLANYGGNNPFKVASWRELRSETERQRYTTLLNF